MLQGTFKSEIRQTIDKQPTQQGKNIWCYAFLKGGHFAKNCNIIIMEDRKVINELHWYNKFCTSHGYVKTKCSNPLEPFNPCNTSTEMAKAHRRERVLVLDQRAYWQTIYLNAVWQMNRRISLWTSTTSGGLCLQGTGIWRYACYDGLFWWKSFKSAQRQWMWCSHGYAWTSGRQSTDWKISIMCADMVLVVELKMQLWTLRLLFT